MTSLTTLASIGDAHGGRFHLLVGVDDWASCLETDPLWPQRHVLADDGVHPPSRFEWQPTTGSLRLAHREVVARHRAQGAPRSPDERRGAARDRYGNWFWITPDRRGIVHLTPGARQASDWWSLDDLAPNVASCLGGFVSAHAPHVERTATLAGLAITTGHRLAAGLVDGLGGLLLFDLHATGAPLVLRWPHGRVITPFDVAETRAGGVLVLDRARRTWWRLDSGWRLQSDVTPGAPATFQPEDAAAPRRATPPSIEPRPNLLTTRGRDAVVDPVSIAEAADRTVLLLDRPTAGPSAVVLADPSAPGGVLARLVVQVEALDPTRLDLPAFVHDVIGQDMCASGAADKLPLAGPLIYVADAATGGTEAFTLQHRAGTAPRLIHQPDELPMRSWEAKGIVAVDGDVYYDAVGRWIPLEPFGLCNMERSATLRTRASFADHPVIGQPFDSGTAHCVWHRLLLDADVSSGCTITVAARASDDPALLEQLAFVPQPAPYRRTAGSELPWHDPWAAVQRPSPTAGTWELLFQHVVGRWSQLEITLTGTGRSTPSLRALRAWYPRFSYVRAHLPTPYQEDDEPDHFLERMLANVEGLLTEHEHRLDHAFLLSDARTTPAAALDWLASWVGLSLEPAWSTARRRFLVRHVDRLYRMRGTIGGLRSLLRLYLGCSLDPNIVFAASPRTDDPARIVDRIGAHRFRVLIPERLDEDRAAMVTRIVAAARPAHTAFEVRSYAGLLLIGEGQVGVDTVVGSSAAFVPITLGATPVAAGTLAAAHPFEITDRVVTGRDRLGEVPPL